MFVRTFVLGVLALLFTISAFAQSASFGGTVRNTAGAPLADMTVQAYNASGIPVTTRTNAQGGYTLFVAPGSYRLVAFDHEGGYAVAFYGGANSFEKSPALHVTEGQVLSGINFTLSPGLRISGCVGNASAQMSALHGAVVAAYNLDGTRKTFVTTGSDGTYTLTVPAGSYKVVAYHETAAFIPMFFQSAPLFESAAVVTPPASNVSFALTMGEKILGSVVEQHSGRPLGGLPVVAYNLAGAVAFRTDTNPIGNFSFVLPPGQSYKFAVEDPAGIYQTTFYRDATSFASAATVRADSAAPLLRFSIRKIPDAEPKTTLFVPGVIHNSGQGGTFFKTDVWMQNPGDTPLAVTVTYLAAGTEEQAFPVTIPARGQVFLQDVVQSVFRRSGAGALRLQAAGNFRATSRTYNVPANASVTGTFGLSIPAQGLGSSLGQATLTGLAHNAESRTNIGLMNPQPDALDVTIDVFAADGSLLGSRTLRVEPGQWLQPGVGDFARVPFDHAYAVVSSPQGSFFSYAAVVDNKSGDGTIILPAAD